MRVRWLGWAGVEIEAEGEAVRDRSRSPTRARPSRALGEDARERIQLPAVAPPEPRGDCARRAGQPPAPRSHRRRRAGRGTRARMPRSTSPPGRAARTPRTSPSAQANVELERAALERRAVADLGRGSRSAPSRSRRCPPSTGSATRRSPGWWRRAGMRILHLGDTIFHGYWWRMARRHGPFDVVLAPINGAGRRLPAPAAAEPAGGGDGAGAGGPRRRAARRPDRRPDPLRRLSRRPLVPAGPRRPRSASRPRRADRAYEVRVLEPGESFEPAIAR